MKALAQNTLIQNRYLIVHLIGKGGMGEVYLAVDQRLGSAVALKRTYFAGDEMLGNAFEREARTLARMRHPVLPKVSDHFGEGEEQYLVMEHISGEDLSKRLEAAQKPFPISWVLFWADQLLDALSYLHTHEPPIIHRDIKPQNLKLTDENNIILLDFGLSKTSTGQTNISQSGSTGSVVGYTPHYAPMEQIRGIGTSARSDLYSLSATLYQLLTNTIPADALSRADNLLNGSPDPVVPLHELNPEVSKSVSDVIFKGMEVSQEKRFSDAREMQKVLRKAFSDMQNAMSANTVAFTPNIDQDATGRPLDDDGTLGTAMPPKSPSETDFDATIAYDPGLEPSVPRQSDVKTEVFLAGSNSLPIPERTDSYPPIERAIEPEWTPPDMTPGTDFTADESYDESAFEEPGEIPDETVAGINFETPPPSVEPEIAPALAAVNPVNAQAKKGSKKAPLVLAGVAALLLLSVAAVAGGWYVYSNYYTSTTASDEPEPSPAPTFEATPSPMPTFEATSDSNSVGNISNSSITPTDLTVAPTPAPTIQPSAAQQTETSSRPATATSAPARTPQVRTAATPATPRATPRPKTPDRTVILQ